MNLTTTLSSRVPDLFDCLTDDVEVRQPEYRIRYNQDCPFNHHCRVTVMIPDSETAEIAYKDYLSPAVRSLAYNVQWFDTIEVESLRPHNPNLGTVCWVTERRIPLRITADYDSVEKGTNVTIEALFRHVGDYQRTIINGPLHLHKMPFSYDPKDGHEFDYLYLPFEKKYYGHFVFTNEDGCEGEWQRLPGLESCVEDDSIHRYRVSGDYCYYMGETLKREY